ncbi:hypothetical protein HDU76_013573, partial [Blyttiomyces sp. JEL0837]
MYLTSTSSGSGPPSNNPKTTKKSSSKSSSSTTNTTLAITPIQPFPWFHSVFEDPIAEQFRQLGSISAKSEQTLVKDVAVHATQTGVLLTPPNPMSMVAIDCEMVAVQSSITEQEAHARKGGVSVPKGLPVNPNALKYQKSALARVSIVDFEGNVLLDEFCKPAEEIVDYKTQFSGVTPQLLENAPPASVTQQKVAKMLADRVVVGQSLDRDLEVLELELPPTQIRDTALFYRRFHPLGKFFGLKDLARWNLGLEIQTGSHDSVVDARTAMLLYRQVRALWEITCPILENVPMDNINPLPVPDTLPPKFKEVIQSFDTKTNRFQLLSQTLGKAVPIQSQLQFQAVPGTSLPPSTAATTMPIVNSIQTPEPTLQVPIVVGTPQELKLMDHSTVHANFYSWIPLDKQPQPFFKFAGPPQWLVPVGTKVTDENLISASEIISKSNVLGSKVEEMKRKKRLKNKERKRKRKGLPNGKDGEDAGKDGEESESGDDSSDDESEDQDKVVKKAKLDPVVASAKSKSAEPVKTLKVANGKGKAAVAKDDSSDESDSDDEKDGDKANGKVSKMEVDSDVTTNMQSNALAGVAVAGIPATLTTGATAATATTTTTKPKPTSNRVGMLQQMQVSQELKDRSREEVVAAGLAKATLKTKRKKRAKKAVVKEADLKGKGKVEVGKDDSDDSDSDRESESDDEEVAHDKKSGSKMEVEKKGKVAVKKTAEKAKVVEADWDDSDSDDEEAPKDKKA